MLPALVRPLLVAASAFGSTLLAYGARRALAAGGVQRWEELGLGWLTLDLWSRLLFWKHAAAAAVVALALAAVIEVAVRRLPALAALGRVTRFFGHPAVAAVLLALPFVVPRLAAAAKQPAAPAGSPNVLFVLVDTWRADHAGFLGYERDVSPGLDALVEDGVVFERAIAQSGWTKPSVATLFTGRVPSMHRAVSQPVQGIPVRGINLLPGETTFVEVLRGAGWDTAMWSNNPNILPIRGFDQGAGYFVDYFSQRAPGRDPGRAEFMLADVERWLEEERDSGRPFCAYVHVMDPHYPYQAPPPFGGTYDRSGLDFQLAGPLIDEYMAGERDLDAITPEMVQRLLDAYDEELAYVDHHLAPFLERVRARYPDTLVIVSGDHGEEFLDHGQLGHSHTVYQELTHTPLVMWGPGLPARRVGTQVRLMDVFPTMLDLLGLADLLPPGVQGTTLRPVIEGTEAKHRLAPMETGGDERPAFQWRALSDGEHKLIRREPDLRTRRPIPSLEPGDREEDRPAWKLFDLTADPGEHTNIHADYPDLSRAFFATMVQEGWWKPPTDVLRLPSATADVDENELELLRSLGYAE